MGLERRAGQPWRLRGPLGSGVPPLPQKRLTMRKLKEVLRLASLGLSQHQIARSCSLSQSTVHEYVSAGRASGVQLPIPADWIDHQIEQQLFPQRTAPIGWRKHPEPDWPPILEELQKEKDLTLADPSSDLARTARERSGGVRLQQVLRSVPALAEQARPGAAPRTSRRREDVCRLCRRHDPHL